MRRFSTEISGNRRPKAEISPETRSAILYSLEKGVSPSKIACDHHVSRSSIYYTKIRSQNYARVKSKPRSGRLQKFNDRTRRYIFQLARKYPQWTYAALGANIPGMDIRISRSTIRRLLRIYRLRK
jgi:transposase